MDPQKIELLFKRYLQNQCSPEEIQLLFQYFDAAENEAVLKDLIQAELESSDNTDTGESSKVRLDKVFQNLKKAIQKNK